MLEEAATVTPKRGLPGFLFGRSLPWKEDRRERVGTATGIPVFGLVALSSAAHGPEAAFTILVPLGALGLAYVVPISTVIIVLLSIVFFSYMQIIGAYPMGGASYTVSSQNLGVFAGLLAAALMIDYVLNVAVGISAGVGAVISAIPELQPPYVVSMSGNPCDSYVDQSACIREAGVAFMMPQRSELPLAELLHRSFSTPFRGNWQAVDYEGGAVQLVTFARLPTH